MLPTYDERSNLRRTVESVRALSYDVLVVDDNSPDGTGDLAEELASADGGVAVLHRAAKLGLGSAYVAGFKWGLERGYRFLVEMDSDGSHLPHHLPQIVEAAEDSGGLAIGSRYIPGGLVSGWGWRRKMLSRGANAYCRIILGLDVHDATSGFRCYPARLLENIGLEDVISEGYSFQIELVHRCVQMGFPVLEVPIRFEDRVHGRSKVSEAEIRAALVNVVRFRFRGRSAARLANHRAGSD